MGGKQVILQDLTIVKMIEEGSLHVLNKLKTKGLILQLLEQEIGTKQQPEKWNSNNYSIPVAPI